MKKKSHGLGIIAMGIILAIAACPWATAPIRGLCPERFRSTDEYHIRLVLPMVKDGSAWDRTYEWAIDEFGMRVSYVCSAFLAYNIAGLIYLRRKARLERTSEPVTGEDRLEDHANGNAASGKANSQR